MTANIRAIRGFRDIHPEEAFRLHDIEARAREHFLRYGYHEIRLPVVEVTELFARSIGETTDIVEKEMYTFEDRNGQSITLRPEGTASAVRAYLQGGLKSMGGITKIYYSGPMFRYERPQKGRYRQFYQMGLEAIGGGGPLVDAEVIDLLHKLFELLEVNDTRILINSLGCGECRPSFRKKLVEFLESTSDKLCSNCKKRIKTNPLRVLDCKVPVCIEALKDSPVMLDFLCPDCTAHFDRVTEALNGLEVPYEVDPRIVRGLDYYNRTAFEAVCERLGAQNAVAAGGRYDGLASELGGDAPGIGFAIGMERLSQIVDWKNKAISPPDYYIASATPGARIPALNIADLLRSYGYCVETDLEDRSLKAQLRSANKLNIRSVVIMGDDELERGVLKLKDFDKKTQVELSMDELIESAANRSRSSKGDA
ncbi:MAG: histidine--tRNA ligase [bacterium]